MIDCREPFSFYFDLISHYWKTPSSDYVPLHRVATLARKQGVQSIVVESALSRPEVQEEIDDLDEAFGGGGTAEALSMTFFNCDVGAATPADLEDRTVIGQCVLINYRAHRETNFSVSFIFEAIFATPSNVPGTRRLLNNFVYAEAPFMVPVRGRELTVTGVYFCQQNGHTNVCAHASLRMVVNTLHGNGDRLRSRQINELLATSGGSAMSPMQMKRVIEELGDLHADLVGCESMNPANYVSILTAAAESGEVALLVFTTGATASVESEGVEGPPEVGPDNVRHVVMSFGHTLNSDEWHPQAIPAYSGHAAARYVPSSSWVDHFVIHDDNFGPYFTLSSRALEMDSTVKAEAIIVVRKRESTMKAHVAEGWASTILSTWVPILGNIGGSPWLEHMNGTKRDYVTRPLLVTREGYVAHLMAARAHDGSVATNQSVAMFEGLPAHFWMVEFTLPDLFTGNKSKLGEILIDASWNPDRSEPPPRAHILGMRLPGYYLSQTEQEGALNLHAFGILSHCAIYRTAPHDHEW